MYKSGKKFQPEKSKILRIIKNTLKATKQSLGENTQRCGEKLGAGDDGHNSTGTCVLVCVHANGHACAHARARAIWRAYVREDRRTCVRDCVRVWTSCWTAHLVISSRHCLQFLRF